MLITVDLPEIGFWCCKDKAGTIIVYKASLQNRCLPQKFQAIDGDRGAKGEDGTLPEGLKTNPFSQSSIEKDGNSKFRAFLDEECRFSGAEGFLVELVGQDNAYCIDDVLWS